MQAIPSPEPSPLDPIAVHLGAGRALARFRHQIPEAVRDEICQEATLRAWGAAGVDDARAFAHRIAVRLAIDWLRRRDRGVGPLLAEDCADPAWTRTDARVDATRVLRLLDTAPPRYRELVEEHFVQDQDLEELARAEVLARGEAGERAFVRARDALYKRRNRVLAWLRERLSDDARRCA
jgi:DNA-directed RNA polymerase specialized sigma24 family protein